MALTAVTALAGHDIELAQDDDNNVSLHVNGELVGWLRADNGEMVLVVAPLAAGAEGIQVSNGTIKVLGPSGELVPA